MTGDRARVELGKDGKVGSEQSRYFYTWDSETRQYDNTKAKRAHNEAQQLVDEAEKIRAEIEACEGRLGVIVQELRTLGASWAVVGAALGTSKAAAFKRYAHTELTR